MKMSLEKLREQCLALPFEERLKLCDEIFISMQMPPNNQLTKAAWQQKWRKIAAQRWQDFREGRMPAIPLSALSEKEIVALIA